jgi:Rrf2 family protein
MFSNTQEYALRAMAQLAREDGMASTADVAKAIKAPPAYLTKVMQDLRRAGLINSQRGVGGGVSLAKPAKKISLLDVIEAVDPWQNRPGGKSALDRKLKAIGDGLRKTAAATTLADVAK